jgi:hypothetical protein
MPNNRPDRVKHEEKKSEARDEQRPEKHKPHSKPRTGGDLWRVEKQLLTTDGKGNWVTVGTYPTEAEAEAAAEPLRATENVRITHVRLREKGLRKLLNGVACGGCDAGTGMTDDGQATDGGSDDGSDGSSDDSGQ